MKGATLSSPAFLAEGSFIIRVDTFWAGMLCERGLAISFLAMISVIKKYREIEENKIMIEVRFHGRGGQGAVTSVELLALAAIEEGKFAQGFPSFGPERRGAPVVAFSRVSDHYIRLRSKIYTPDAAVVLDPSLLKIVDPSQGLKPGGLIIINTNKTLDQVRTEFGYQARLALVDADRIAREELGVPIVNTTMLGALIRGTGIVALDSLTHPLKGRFGRGAERNLKALRRAYEETTLSN